MSGSPDRLPPRDLGSRVLTANLRTLVSAFPFVDPNLAINRTETTLATRAVRAPFIDASNGVTQFMTGITYNTETGEIGAPPAVYEAGEWSRIETRLRVEGGDYRNPTPDMRYTLSLQLPAEDNLLPHTFHEFDRGSIGSADRFADAGRLVLPQRLYQESQGIHRRFSFEHWSSFGDLVMMQTIEAFNKQYGPELLGVPSEPNPGR